MKHLRILGISLVVGLFTVAACSSADPTPTTTPANAAAPAGETIPTPAEAPDPTPADSPDRVPAATATEQTQTDSSLPAAATAYSWEITTVDENGAKPSLAVDADGTPHIAYMLEATPGFVKHAVLDSGAWRTSTISTGYFYGPLDIQVDQQGVPHISYHNHDLENEAYAVLDNGQWVVQDVDHPGHDGWDNNLALDSTGAPHTVSIDPSQFGSSSGVEYATLNGGSWTVEEVGSGAVPYEFGTGIALDSRDRPHLVWFDASDKDLKYAFKDGGRWFISTVDSEGDVGRYPSLVVDKTDNPSISYYERISESEGYIKIARWDGDGWNTERIDKLENVFPGFFGARKNSSLVLDKNDNPIVAYSDEQVVRLASWDESGWELQTVVTAGESPLGQQVSLAIDNSGLLHLTFTDAVSKGRPGVKGNIMYAIGTP